MFILTEKGKYHKGVYVGDNIATLEACNLDQSRWEEVVIEEGAFLPPRKNLCKRCFKEELSYGNEESNQQVS